jgi:hypothetical protein
MSFAYRRTIRSHALIALADRRPSRRVGLALEIPQGLEGLLVVVDGVNLSRTHTKRDAGDNRSSNCDNDDHHYDDHYASTTGRGSSPRDGFQMPLTCSTSRFTIKYSHSLTDGVGQPSAPPIQLSLR